MGRIVSLHHRDHSTQMADVLSSQTWKDAVNGEIKGRKAWQAKYGHQFAEAEESCAGSRPQTGRSSVAASRPPTGMSRPQSNMSQSSDNPAQRQKLLDLKKKLTDSFNEVDDELAHTAHGSSCSRR